MRGRLISAHLALIDPIGSTVLGVRQDGKGTDFLGGMPEAIDKSAWETARREFGEEADLDPSWFNELEPVGSALIDAPSKGGWYALYLVYTSRIILADHIACDGHVLPIRCCPTNAEVTRLEIRPWGCWEGIIPFQLTSFVPRFNALIRDLTPDHWSEAYKPGDDTTPWREIESIQDHVLDPNTFHATPVTK